MNDKQKIFLNSLKQMRDYTVESFVENKDKNGYSDVNEKVFKSIVEKVIDQNIFNTLVMIDNGTLLP